jgi:uncharacterized cupredoxin-like copper-binding protein
MSDTSTGPTVEPRPATPRWVKVLGILIVAGLALTVVVMLLSGGRHGPGMHTGQTGASSPNAGATTSSAVGGPADASDATRTVELTTLDSMSFEPDSLTAAPGEVVTFVVTNAGEATHEFTLGDAVMQAEHAAAMDHMPDGMRHELPNSLAIEPGGTKQLTWRFGTAGTLEYACHEPGHYEGGMRGSITVG